MRGVDKIEHTRIYASDNKRLAIWVKTWNIMDKFAKRRTSADALREIFNENLRMKQRITYLNFEAARLIRENKKKNSVNAL